jgi:hypothetical protein
MAIAFCSDSDRNIPKGSRPGKVTFSYALRENGSALLEGDG